MATVTVKQNGNISNNTLVVECNGTRVNQIKDSLQSGALVWRWLDMRRTPFWIYNGHTSAITVGLRGERVSSSLKYPALSYSYDNVNWTTKASSTTAPTFSLASKALVFIRTNINWAIIQGNPSQYLSLYSSRNASNVYLGGNIMTLRGTTNVASAAANTTNTTELKQGMLYHVTSCNMANLLIPSTNCNGIFGAPRYSSGSSYYDYRYGTSVSPIFYVNSSTRNLGIVFNRYANATHPNVLQILATGSVTPTFNSSYTGANCATTGTIYYSNNITWTTASDTTGAFNKGVPTQWTRTALNKTYTTKL